MEAHLTIATSKQHYRYSDTILDMLPDVLLKRTPSNTFKYMEENKKITVADEKKPRRSTTRLTFEDCEKAAKSVSSMRELRTKFSGCYQRIMRSKWLSHFPWLTRERTEKGYWDFERCKKAAEKYTTYRDFRVFDNAAFQSSINHQWIGSFDWLKKNTRGKRKSETAKKESVKKESKSNA